MSAGRKIGKYAAAMMICILILWGAGFSAEAVDVMEQKVTEDTVSLYVRHESSDVDAQIGSVNTDARMESDAGHTRILTWLLLDNSTTMRPYKDKIIKLVESLAGERRPNEKFNLCTFGDTLDSPLREGSQSSSDMAYALDEVNFIERNTYLMGVLDTLMRQDSGSDFMRVVVISDGGDTSPSETITLEELSRKLANENFPIYTISCGVENQPKKNMVALSRLTGARNWDLDSSDAREIASVMCWEEVPTRVDVSVPDDLRDGAIRAVKVTFSDGTSAEAQVRMPQPHAEATLIPEPTVEPPDPLPTEVYHDDRDGGIPVWLIVMLVLLVLLLIGAGVFIFLTVRNKNDAIRPVRGDGLPADRGERTEITGGGYAQNQDRGETSMLGGDYDGYDEDESGSSTQLLVNDNSPRMLYLNDLDHPEKQFSASLREPITVGRVSGNRIVLSYDKSVSGSHCEIYADGAAFRIRDRDSANGTYVDGHRVVDSVEIFNGSTIRLGRLNFKVTIR